MSALGIFWGTLMSRGGVEIWMWSEACELLQRAERLHRQFFAPMSPGKKGVGWEPPVDLYETGTDIWVTVALPGVNPKDIEILSDDATLLISGRRRLPAELRSARIHRIEIPHGLFLCTIRLPAVGSEIVERNAENGCLIIRIRKQRKE